MSRVRPPARTPFHAHIQRCGNATTENPELIRLAAATGYSTSHLYRLALGDRKATRACALAVSKAVRDKSVTMASLMAGATPGAEL